MPIPLLMTGGSAECPESAAAAQPASLVRHTLAPRGGLVLTLALAALLAGCGGGGGGGGSSSPSDPSLEERLPPVVIPDLPPGAPSERFFVFGDQGTGGMGQYLIANAMAARAQAEGLHFVLTTGDNFYPSGVSSANDPDWLSRFEDPYGAPALVVPFYASLGNHDHAGDVDAQVEYSAVSDQWTMPARYYTFTRLLGDGTDAQFFALDTYPMVSGGSSAGPQLEWLETELAASSARWKLVFGHHTISAYGKHGDSKKLQDKLLPVLQAGDVDVYFCGHDHSLQLIDEPGGPLMVVSGSGSGTDKDTSVSYGPKTLYASTGGCFVAARLSMDQLLLEFVRPDGLTQYAHAIDK